MCKVCSVVYSGAALGLVVSTTGSSVQSAANLAKTNDSSVGVSALLATPNVIAQLSVPKIVEPTWLTEQKMAEAAAKARAAAVPAPSRATNGRVVTYDVMTKGVIAANVTEFKQQASATLNDARGWARLGVSFQEVASGGQFTLVLSEAAQVPSFSPQGCGVEYSCRVGRYVIINQDRWNGATPSWNNAGGSLRDYRHMVVNHETGHWLGHGHSQCGGPGQQAPVMQQQSMDLQGCGFNPWPLAGELHSSHLGIGR